MRAPRRHRASTKALPLLAGLVLQASTAYLTLILAGRLLGAARFSGISSLYVLITSIATGLYLPFEQEISRRRGAERARGSSDPRLVPRMVKLALVASALVSAALLCGFSVTLRLLNDNWALVLALCIAIPGYGCAFISRGVFAGTGELTRYGVQLAFEGCFRLVGVIGLGLLGFHRVGGYGWLFGLAPWGALAVSLIGRSPRAVGASNLADTGMRALTKVLAILLVSSLASQLLINAGPVVVQLFAKRSDRAASGQFLAALVVVRLPVLIFTAVQPSFLPSLAALAESRQIQAFRGLIGRILIGVLALSVVSTAILTVWGPRLINATFDFEGQLSRWTYLLAGISVGLFLASTIMAQALLGLDSHASATVGWLIGLAGLAAGTALTSGAVARATSGFFCGAIASSLTLGVLLLSKLKIKFALTQDETRVLP